MCRHRADVSTIIHLLNTALGHPGSARAPFGIWASRGFSAGKAARGGMMDDW